MTNHHTRIDTQESMRTITRDEVINAFRPMSNLLWEVIEEARIRTDESITSDAFPHLRRVAHLRRLAGSARWMHIADRLVERRGDLPDGFSVESTETQHNQGIYIFRFPGGVFTVKRAPHKNPDEGLYLQDTIEGFEQVALAAGIDAGADLIVFLSVPPAKEPRLIVTHPTLTKDLIIGLEELRTPITVDEIDPARSIERTSVRSTRRTAATDDAAGKDS